MIFVLSPRSSAQNRLLKTNLPELTKWFSYHPFACRHERISSGDNTDIDSDGSHRPDNLENSDMCSSYFCGYSSWRSSYILVNRIKWRKVWTYYHVLNSFNTAKGDIGPSGLMYSTSIPTLSEVLKDWDTAIWTICAKLVQTRTLP